MTTSKTLARFHSRTFSPELNRSARLSPQRRTDTYMWKKTNKNKPPMSVGLFSGLSKIVLAVVAVTCVSNHVLRPELKKCSIVENI